MTVMRTAIAYTQPPVNSVGVEVGSMLSCACAIAGSTRTPRAPSSAAGRIRERRRTAAILTREPEVGFEPTTYHLRGGCSARLSYSGGPSESINGLRTHPAGCQRGSLDVPA